jgi:hypothetical protein
MAQVTEAEEPPLESEQYDEEGVPLWLEIWGKLIHAILYTAYFFVIICMAIAIDLSLHWFEKRPFVEYLQLSRVIKWEIELMAYSLAGVDCFLFMRRLIEPLVTYVRRFRTL